MKCVQGLELRLKEVTAGTPRHEEVSLGLLEGSHLNNWSLGAPVIPTTGIRGFHFPAAHGLLLTAVLDHDSAQEHRSIPREGGLPLNDLVSAR